MTNPNPTPTEAIAALIEAAREMVAKWNGGGIASANQIRAVDALESALAACEGLPPSLAGMVLVPVGDLQTALGIIEHMARLFANADKRKIAWEENAARLRACLPGAKP